MSTTNRILLSSLCLLIAFLSLFLIFGIEREEGLKISQNLGYFNDNGLDMINKLVGIKTSKKVYLPWCNGAERAKVSNTLIFENLDDALKEGFTKAKRCFPN